MWRVMEEIKKNGLKVNAIKLNSFVDGYSKKGEWRKLGGGERDRNKRIEVKYYF